MGLLGFLSCKNRGGFEEIEIISILLLLERFKSTVPFADYLSIKKIGI